MARLSASDLQTHGTEPKLEEAISFTAAGTSYSSVLDLRNYNVGDLEAYLKMIALVGGTFDVTPEISHDGQNFVAHNTTFTQQAAGSPTEELLDLKNFLGNFVRFKFVAGAGVTSAVGTLWAVGKGSS